MVSIRHGRALECWTGAERTIVVLNVAAGLEKAGVEGEGGF